MAQRRMISKKVIDTDLFLDMPITSRLLYYELCMRADDDGFVSSPKKIMRMAGCSGDDMRVLKTKQFVLDFETGILVIKHWRVHNYIRSDRYTETEYKAEKSMLVEVDNKYEFKNVIPDVTPNGSTGKVRLGKVRLDINNVEKLDNIPYKEIVEYLNQNTGKHFKHTTNATQRSIKARFKEGFNLNDFKKVIDIKVSKWLNDDKMAEFLRPQTIFGTKFESYLNEEVQDGKANREDESGFTEFYNSIKK